MTVTRSNMYVRPERKKSTGKHRLCPGSDRKGKGKGRAGYSSHDVQARQEAPKNLPRLAQQSTHVQEAIGGEGGKRELSTVFLTTVLRGARAALEVDVGRGGDPAEKGSKNRPLEEGEMKISMQSVRLGPNKGNLPGKEENCAMRFPPGCTREGRPADRSHRVKRTRSDQSLHGG